MGLRWAAALSALAAGTIPLSAPAQTAGQAGGVANDRVGADRPTPALPPYAHGASPLGAPLTAPAQGVPTAPASDAETGSILIRDIYVGGDAGAYPPKPAPLWRPASADAAGLLLVHEAGETLDARWIRRQFVTNGMVGETVAYARVVALLQLINRAYLANYYINSGVVLLPQPAGAGDGLLRLKLISGRATSADSARGMDVRWRDGHRRLLTSGYIRDRLPSARKVPLSIADLERDFRLLADDPVIRSVNADLRPSDTRGLADLVVTVEPQPPVDAYVSYGNSRSPSVGGERLGFGGSLRNLPLRGAVLSAEVGTTEGLTDFVSSLSAPVSRSVTLLARGGFDNAAVVDRPLVPLDIRSREWSAEGGASVQVLAEPLTPIGADGALRPAQNLALGLLVAHHHLTTTLAGAPFSFSPGAHDGRTEYTAARITADYTRRSITSVLALSFTGSLGLAGTRPEDPTVSRVSRDFKAMLVQANYAHRLDAHQLELRIRLSGQAANGVLYSPERFTLGGLDTVRGYRENLLLADEAAVGSVELARPFNLRPSVTSDRGAWTSFTLSIFADGGYAHNLAQPQPTPRHIGSVGVDAVWNPAPWVFARVSYARALNHVTAPGRRDLEDHGFAFRLVLHPLGLLHMFGS